MRAVHGDLRRWVGPGEVDGNGAQRAQRGAVNHLAGEDQGIVCRVLVEAGAAVFALLITRGTAVIFIEHRLAAGAGVEIQP